MPTRPTAVAAAQRFVLRGDETALHRRLAPRLHSTIAHALNAPPELVEDACQFAWIQLCRHQPQRGPHLFAWLRTTALREGYRLIALEHRHPRALRPATKDNGQRTANEPVDPDDTPCRLQLDHALEAREALRALAALPQRQRQYATLRTIGYSYNEIAALTGHTYTNVNKHLTRARERLREAA